MPLVLGHISVLVPTRTTVQHSPTDPDISCRQQQSRFYFFIKRSFYFSPLARIQQRSSSTGNNKEEGTCWMEKFKLTHRASLTRLVVLRFKKKKKSEIDRNVLMNLKDIF